MRSHFFIFLKVCLQIVNDYFLLCYNWIVDVMGGLETHFH